MKKSEWEKKQEEWRRKYQEDRKQVMNSFTKEERELLFKLLQLIDKEGYDE